VTIAVKRLVSVLLSGANRKYEIWLTPISAAIAFSVSAKSSSLWPRIVSVSCIAAESIPMLDVSTRLRSDTEYSDHHFVASMSNHPAGGRIDPPGDMATQFEEFDADAI
jgi:hypothetical protein